MSFTDLVNYKKKINSTLNIFDWLNDMNDIQDVRSNSILFLLRLGIFFYFVFFVFLLHFLYRVFKKQLLRKKYLKMLSDYVKENGYNISYWRSKVNEEIKKEQKEFFEENKAKQELNDSDY